MVHQLDDPPDRADPPCVICNKSANDCECPECPECGDAGCIKHLPDDVILRMDEAYNYWHTTVMMEVARREKERSIKCTNCGAPVPANLRYGHRWCEECDNAVKEE